MKKMLVIFSVMIGTLMLFVMFIGGAHAGQDQDAWTKVHADWPASHGYYKANPNGMVHEKWSCDSNWQNCDGYAQYFPASKFEEQPLDTACGEEIFLLLWQGTTEYPDDEGDASDFLIIGETYWFCDRFGEEVFRGSE